MVVWVVFGYLVVCYALCIVVGITLLFGLFVLLLIGGIVGLCLFLFGNVLGLWLGCGWLFWVWLVVLGCCL